MTMAGSGFNLEKIIRARQEPIVNVRLNRIRGFTKDNTFQLPSGSC